MKNFLTGILTSAMVLSMATLSNASTRLEISQQTTDGLDAGSHTIKATPHNHTKKQHLSIKNKILSKKY